MVKFILALVSFATTIQGAFPPDTCLSAAWVTDGQVRAITANGDKVYIGGKFSYTGPYTGAAASISTSGALQSPFPILNSKVTCVVSDGSGGWYVGGDFNFEINGTLYACAAHIKSDGTIDPDWKYAGSSVAKIFKYGSTVYICNLGGPPYIVALDATTGAPNTTFNTNLNSLIDGGVSSIAISGSTLYVGGNFRHIGGQARNLIAAINATTGLATSWNANLSFSYGYSVNAIVTRDYVSDTIVYIGGSFPYQVNSTYYYNVAGLSKNTAQVIYA